MASATGDREQTRDGNKELLQEPETLASRLKAVNYKAHEIIKRYMKKLSDKNKESEEYFDLKSAPQVQQVNDSDDDSDSDLEDEYAEHNIAQLDDDEQFLPDTASSEDTTLSIIRHQTQSGDQKKHYLDQESHEWEVECTPHVLKLLKHKKTAGHLCKAFYEVVFHDLPQGRHWYKVKTHDLKHQLFQKEILHGKVTMLWERAVQFSSKLTGNDVKNPIYADVIRVWDIVMHKRSVQQRINAIERAWSRERGTNIVPKNLRLIESSESQNQASIRRIFKPIPVEHTCNSDSHSDIEVIPPVDPDPKQYQTLILHPVPHNIELLVSSSCKFDLPIKLQPEEDEIVKIHTAEPIIILGRSGTGKTTCCLYRMVQEFLSYCECIQSSTEEAYLSPLRQLFVTKNKHLCKKFGDQFLKLVNHHPITTGFLCNTAKKSDPNHLQELQCPLFLTWEEFLLLLDSSLRKCTHRDIKFKDDKDYPKCFDSHLTITGTKVTASYFASTIWKEVGSKLQNKHAFDPRLVWMEIKSFIKGYTASGNLSRDEYVELSPRIAPNFAELREEIYDIYEHYKHYCEASNRLKSIQLYDDGDLVLELYEKMRHFKLRSYDTISWLFDSLYVDEVQDFAQSEILLLIQSCKSPRCNVFLTGDTAQTVMKDVSFRFIDLKTLFFKNDIIAVDQAPPIVELKINYRSHSGILNLAKSVLNILEKHFPDSLDKVPSDQGMLSGPTPKFIKPCPAKTLMLVLAANHRTPSDMQFGHHQAVIVRSEGKKQHVPIENALVFSVYESKGLEFDDVLLYNFFSDCEVKDVWNKGFKGLQSSFKTPLSLLLNAELKQLYTVITRAKVNLWIYESEPIDDHLLPILTEWRDSTEPLIDVIDLNDSNVKLDASFATVKHSTRKQWKSQGDLLKREERLKQAALCYKLAHRFDLAAETEVMALEAEPSPSRSQYHDIAVAYLKLDEIAHNANHLVKVANNLLHAAKSAEDYLDIAWLYKTLKMKQDAIHTYIKGGHHIKASQLHEEYEEYSEAIQVLINARLYVEAAAKAKMLEDINKCPPEFSSFKIAKQYILKYCIPPWSINETEDRIFNELLKYIKSTNKGLQIAFLKHAKRFSEALESHFQSQDYAKFYRLAFAQGPNTIVSPEKSTLGVITYYDSALRLSSALGHNEMNAAFVINYCRSCLDHPDAESEESHHVFSITQLEYLSVTPNKDANIQVNAHLLLAKYDQGRVADAIQVCRQHKCLPGEIELLVFVSDGKKLSSCYSTTSYQLEIVHKICFLLSLDQKGLINAYKDILGLCEGKMDKLYNEQAEFTAHLQLSSFVTDCYLLPHKSQDIWLKTIITQEKKYTRDIDGMYVIQQDTLFRHIKSHLEQALNKALSKIIPQSPLYNLHLELSCEYSCIKFDTKCISACLDYCELALLHSSKSYEHKAVQILRQYHSIGNVHCLPLCENYMLFIDHIRRNRRVWKFFQSQTTQLITETLSKCDDHFDSLKLWEQSSVAMVTDVLRKNLENHGSKADCTNLFKSCRAVTMWLNISEGVLNDPMNSCHEFFNDCLPELLKIGRNLHSIVNSIIVYGTIALALVSCTAYTPPLVVPQLYFRALSVYDSLLLKSQNQTILSACCDLIPGYCNNELVLLKLLQLIEKALDGVISLLRKESVYECEDLPRQCLILVLTLFTNFIVLQPQPSNITRISSKLNKCIDLKIKLCEMFKLNYHTVGAAIKHAKSTSDFIKVIQYLLSNSSTCSDLGRYETLALLVSKQQTSIKITVLSDEEVKHLPPVTILKSKEVPSAKIEHELTVVPLLSVARRKRDLYFKIHPFRGKYLLARVNLRPPWAYFPSHERGVEQPADLLDFVDLGFPQDLRSSTIVITGSTLGCQVCKLEKEENHVLSAVHKRNLALYKQFLALHDSDYIRYEAKFRKASKRIKPQAEALLTSMNNMITAVYKRGDWKKGIELIQVYCIPKVKDMIVGISSQ